MFYPILIHSRHSEPPQGSFGGHDGFISQPLRVRLPESATYARHVKQPLPPGRGSDDSLHRVANRFATQGLEQRRVERLVLGRVAAANLYELQRESSDIDPVANGVGLIR